MTPNLHHPLNKAWRGFVFALFAALLFGNAVAQRVPYCNVTGVETKQLQNGVQVTIQADGIIDAQFDFGFYFNLEALRMGNWQEFPKFTTVLPMRLRNARSRIGSVVDVGTYPVSHVEASIPAESTDGVGLDLKVVLFEAAYTVGINTPSNNDTNFWNEYPDKPAVRFQMPPDQRSIIIIVSTDRRVAVSEVRTRPADGTKANIDIQRIGDRLTLNTLNAPLQMVAAEIAKESGRPVAVEDGLQRWVSLNLPEVTTQEALDSIARMYGLALQNRGAGFLLADSAMRTSPSHVAGDWAPIKLKNITATAARASLPDFLLRFVSLDLEANALMVTGSPEMIQKVREDLEKIDQPSPTLEFETVVVETIDEMDFEQAFEVWGGTGRMASDVSLAEGQIRVNYLETNPTVFNAKLRGLLAQGKGKIVARNVMRVQTGKEARLFAGQQRLAQFEYIDRFSNELATDLIPVDLGSTLKAKGWVKGTTILMEVSPAVTSISSLDPTTGLPTVSSRSAKATLVIQSGETILIGGLDSEQKSHSTAKIPLLGDLPLIGGWFRIQKKSSSRTSLQMFVTARVVQPENVKP